MESTFLMGSFVYLLSLYIMKPENGNLTDGMPLTATTLKLIGIVTMTIDHIGYFLFPEITVLRIIGRIAYPVFAYFIAEGCTYTRHKSRYLFSVLSVGVFCSVISFVSDGSMYQSVMITFACSIGLIFLLDKVRSCDLSHKGSKLLWYLIFFAVTVFFFLLFKVHIIPGLDTDYGFWGIITPVLIRLGRGKLEKLAAMVIGLALICYGTGGIQIYSFLALIPLTLYNGQRGKRG